MIDFFTTKSKIPYRVEPFEDESLRGYLIRLTEIFHLESLSYFLTEFTGHSVKIPNTSHLLTMSHYLGLAPACLIALTGMDRRWSDGHYHYRIGKDWINDERYFLTQYMQVCPACLNEQNYIRRIWHLCFYTCCHQHHTKLISACPQCGKQLYWYRERVAACACGYDFRNSTCDQAKDEGKLISHIIANKTERFTFSKKTSTYNSLNILDYLSRLNLNELSHSIWYLGHALPHWINGKSLHGRRKLIGESANSAIKYYLDMLDTWPESYHDMLQDYVGNTDIKHVAPRAFGPIHRHALRTKVTGPFAIHAAFIDFIKSKNLTYTPDAGMKKQNYQYSLF